MDKMSNCLKWVYADKDHMPNPLFQHDYNLERNECLVGEYTTTHSFTHYVTADHFYVSIPLVRTYDICGEFKYRLLDEHGNDKTDLIIRDCLTSNNRVVVEDIQTFFSNDTFFFSYLDLHQANRLVFKLNDIPEDLSKYTLELTMTMGWMSSWAIQQPWHTWDRYMNSLYYTNDRVSTKRYLLDTHRNPLAPFIVTVYWFPEYPHVKIPLMGNPFFLDLTWDVNLYDTDMRWQVFGKTRVMEEPLDINSFSIYDIVELVGEVKDDKPIQIVYVTSKHDSSKK